MKSISVPQTYKNRVLASLPADEMKRLAPYLSQLTLKMNRSLHDPGQVVDAVYFLVEGICSHVVIMEAGNTVEVGTTGRDGFVGPPAML